MDLLDDVARDQQRRREGYNALADQMLRHVENGTTDQADTILEVPTSAYTDPNRWTREVELIFKRLPLMMALTIELPNPGDYKAMEMVGLPILLTRGKDGKARAFLNVCTHRGAPVAEIGKGHCNRFTCPYHGWTFTNDGALMGVAEADKFGPIDRASRNLTALPCEERAGMIFAVLTPGAPIDVEQFLGGMLEDLAHFGLETWHYVGSREIFGGNWKIAYDGYLEGYHFAALHPQTILPFSLSGVNHYDAFGPHMRIGFPRTTIGDLRDHPADHWWAREQEEYGFVRTLFPNISIALGLGVGQVAQLIPGPTPDKNRTILNYIHPHAPRDEGEAAEMEQAAQFLRDVTNDEDYVLGLKIQKGMESGALESVVFGRNERGNQFFHKCVEHYLNGDPSTPFPSL